MARKLLISIMCVMAAVTVMAQEVRPYEPMLVDGRSWTYNYIERNGKEENLKDVLTETVCGDTILEGEACKKVLCKFEKSGEKWYCVAKEEDRRVYNYFKGYDNGEYINKKKLIYDFNVSIGHVFPIYEYFSGEHLYNWTVTHDEYIESCGKQWRELILGDEYSTWYHIEGIGPYSDFNNGFDAPAMHGRSRHSGGLYVEFQDCRQDGEVIFMGKDIKKLPPKPSGVESVAVEDTQGGMIYDIYGRRVEHPQRGHIYIRDGCKFVQR